MSRERELTAETPASPVVQIRLAEPHEAPRVATVLYQSFVEYETLYTREGFAATESGTDRRSHARRTRLAGMPRAPSVGDCRRRREGQSVYMRGMGVVPDARGLGIGAGLLEQVERWATDQGGLRIFLSTTPFLNAAIRFYERFGFRRTDEGPHDLSRTPLFTMDKNVPRRN